jgi:hypothetical protein
MLRVFGLMVFAVLAGLGVAFSGLMDGRPVERLLFVGHSRTYHNNLPELVAEIADSAGSPVRYEVEMSAGAGADLKKHWQSKKTRDLLNDHHWDQIIIQPNIVWREDDDFSDFMTFGSRFVAESAKHAKTSVVIDWPMKDAFYTEHGWTRAEHVAKTRADNWRLASRNGAQTIDVARVWEDVSAEPLPFSLYTDNDHPSVQGSYLVALAIAAEVAGTDLAKVDYVPSGMTDEEGALLRERVQRSLAAG